MSKIFSNGPNDGFIEGQFTDLIKGSNRALLAAPYFTLVDPLYDAAKAGKDIQVLVGLNEATSPEALRKIFDLPSVKIRFYANRFHAKIFIFDQSALLGSANLTKGGLYKNREAVIRLDRETDSESYNELYTLFEELWQKGKVLTQEYLHLFEKKHARLCNIVPNTDKYFENAFGKIQPYEFNVGKHNRINKPKKLESLRQRVYEKYQPAFDEVTDILEENNFRRTDLAYLGIEYETNRFLNYIKLTHMRGPQALQNIGLLSQQDRFNLITHYAQEWVETENSKVPECYNLWLGKVKTTFRSPTAITNADNEQIMDGLMSIHAFFEQRRFVKGGELKLPMKFWEKNYHDINRVKNTLNYFLYGSDDFIKRLYDVLNDKSIMLNYFGFYCALELYGTINPIECPPMNSRTVKALYFLGFDVERVYGKFKDQ